MSYTFNIFTCSLQNQIIDSEWFQTVEFFLQPLCLSQFDQVDLYSKKELNIIHGIESIKYLSKFDIKCSNAIHQYRVILQKRVVLKTVCSRSSQTSSPFVSAYACCRSGRVRVMTPGFPLA